MNLISVCPEPVEGRFVIARPGFCALSPNGN
jgi:hypothetical protein